MKQRLMMALAMLSCGVALAADDTTAMQYAEKYAHANTLRLVWNLDTDYVLNDVPATYTEHDLSQALFQASKLRGDVKGNINDKLLAAVVCNKTTLIVEPLSYARKRIGHGCEAHNLEPSGKVELDADGHLMIERNSVAWKHAD